MIREIKRVSIGSVVPIAAAAHLVMGILGIATAIISTAVVGRPAASFTMSLGPFNFSFDGAPSLSMLLIYPFIAAIAGAVYFAFFIWLYNLLARWIAPISVELSE